ncbi:hypothetical protein ACFWPU_01060 [Streptomyces sp. NPDC058471]|uniref:hypothetical protein n=1 Tax=Streptomyces sp. NPDC058471 TaxID=3346516 RepID=UPI0036692803
MASNYGLGPDYDISVGVSPLDLGTARTGGRINMANVKSVDIVFVKGAGTAADDPTVTLRHHTASTGGVSADLAVITDYYLKQETTLDGDETWTHVTQSAAATIVGNGTSAETEQLVVVNVRADALPLTSNWLSLDIADVGTNAQLGAVLYIMHKHDKGDPVDFPAPLR